MNTLIAIADTNPPLYNGKIFPSQKKVLSKWTAINVSIANFDIVSNKKPLKSVPLAIKILKKRLDNFQKSTNCIKVTLVLGVKDSPIMKKYNFKTTNESISQGYSLRFLKSKDNLTILACGNDNRGTFYAAMTLLQMLNSENSSLNYADIDDWSEWKERFFGEYGPSSLDNIELAPKMKEALPRKFKVQRRRLRSVMQDLIYIACKRTRHSGSIFLKFGRHCPWFDVFRQLYVMYC